MSQSEWVHKDLWRRRGKTFCVEVSRHISGLSSWDMGSKGVHRWCVYAYIYPAHPHCALFKGDSSLQAAAMILPLHWGASLLRYHCGADGKTLSVQVGADYDHLDDDAFTFLATPEHASEVFADADELFAWLEQKETTDGTERIRSA